jgi:glutamine synthetase
MLLPACLRYQTEVAEAIEAAEDCGVESPEQANLLRELVESVSSLRKAALNLDEAVAGQPDGAAMAHAKYQRDVVIPAMAELRKAADTLELMVADEYWPLPKYREMLFIR